VDYLALFASALVTATILPFASEVPLALLVRQHDQIAVLTAIQASDDLRMSIEDAADMAFLSRSRYARISSSSKSGCRSDAICCGAS
jgi:hypothetical protein